MIDDEEQCAAGDGDAEEGLDESRGGWEDGQEVLISILAHCISSWFARGYLHYASRRRG